VTKASGLESTWCGWDTPGAGGESRLATVRLIVQIWAVALLFAQWASRKTTVRQFRGFAEIDTDRWRPVTQEGYSLAGGADSSLKTASDFDKPTQIAGVLD
jgi:hypothetical protein